MRKAVIAVAVACAVAVVAGGGYLWALHEGQAELLAAAERIRAGVGPNGSFSYAASAVHPLSRSADLSEVALRGPSGNLLTAARVTVVSGGAGRISALHATGLRASAAAGPGTATAASLDGRDIVLPLPTPGQPVRIDPAAVTFADLTLGTVAVSGPGTSATLTRLEVGDYGAGRPSTLAADGFAAAVPDLAYADHVGFSRLAMSGLDLASAIDAAERRTRPPRLATGPAGFELDGLYLAQAAARPVSVGKLAVSGSSAADGTSSAKLDLTGLSVLPVDAAAKAAFDRIGLQRLDGQASLAAAYAVAGGVFDLQPLLVTADGLGTLRLGLGLAHLDAAALAGGRPDVAEVMRLAQDTQLASASADFTDGGLLDRVLALASKQAGMPPAALRAALVARIGQDPVLASLPDADRIRGALTAFLSGGGRIVVALHPAAPMNVLELAQTGGSDPATLATRLGLSVSNQSGDAPAAPGK